MRKLIASSFVSLDGFMAGSDGSLNWTVGTEYDHDLIPDLLSQVDTLVLGRLTYQMFAAHWPYVSKEQDPLAEQVNTLSKVVCSRSLTNAPWGEWAPARLVQDQVVEAVATLKQQSGKDLMLFGSGSLVSLLTQAGLIDEYHLRVHPVVLGAGKPFFTPLPDQMSLKLLYVQPYPTGRIVLCYQKA
ncbi:dihydrofolate reductase family protein [Ktedonospora formicarum]|uniref:Pyrimidine reductase n=1 Tax=Ktedonospora formicarum TaxID=2778364 RepID=A0A8J3HZW5_9CHLR|nr:dihydrofolate reductase family protein [Ktedonospora formicarum]GHO46784.1 pyrimidine reductase [Ktedonospora formicarum]